MPDFLAGKTQKQRPDEAQAPPSGWALFRNLLGNVRVLIAQSKHYLCFKAFHLFRFVVFDMIVAQQMQATVHHHMRPVRLQRLTLLAGFLLYHLTADDQIAEQRHFNSRRRFKREGEDVGRLILAAIGQVQLMAFCNVDQTNR